MKKITKDRKSKNKNDKKQDGIPPDKRQSMGFGKSNNKEKDDIDSIFSGLNSAKKKQKIEQAPECNDDDSDEKKYFSVGQDGRRYYDGLPVYTIEELQLGDGGDTEDCPIYCDCCT